MAGSKTSAAEPRFATPRDMSRATLGPEVGQVAKRLGMPLMPWQQQVLDVALEVDGDDAYHYDEVDLLVPRQNGKTGATFSMLVHRLIVVARKLGRQRVTYGAQLRQKAKLKLEREFAQILRDAAPSFREITHARLKPSKPSEWKLSLNNGAENIQFGRGNYLQIDAPSRTGGHGDTLDVAVIDEAFAHADDTIETGMSPSMITRRNRQLWVVSTAGDARSYYLWSKVVAGRKACASGRHGRTAYFEWSAPDDADPADPRTWRFCMPALGLLGALTERTIEGEWEKALRGGQDGIDAFRRSFLNQWPKVPQLVDADAITPEFARWMADDALLLDPRRGRPEFGVDVDGDRLAHIAVAWRLPDGRVYVMLAQDEDGNVDSGLSPLRTPARLAELLHRWNGRAAIGGTSTSLEADLPAGRSMVVSSSEFAAACGRFGDLLRDGMLRHGNQPVLNAAVRAARWRPYGLAGERALVLRDAPLVGPVAAVVRALHGLLIEPRSSPGEPQMERVEGRRSETADLARMGF